MPLLSGETLSATAVASAAAAAAAAAAEMHENRNKKAWKQKSYLLNCLDRKCLTHD